MPIKNSLSIRSYSLNKKGHHHGYHQLILPVKGSIHIEMHNFKKKIRPGECLVIHAEKEHYFMADEQARFVVADLNKLPDHFIQPDPIIFSITLPLFHYLGFIDSQLKHQVNPHLEAMMTETFFILLNEQHIVSRCDHRIQNVLDYIDLNFSSAILNKNLADIACLSLTQFKKIFKEQVGLTVTQYVLKVRMDKAQALLLHTDYPIQLVSEMVGYTDHAAFSRRFIQYVGMTPSQFSQ